MLAVRAIRRGGDGVARTPALTVHDGVQVPHRIHLLVEIDEDLVDVPRARGQVRTTGAAATASVGEGLLNFLLRNLLLSLLQQGLAIPHHLAASGILDLLHGVVSIRVEDHQVLVVGHDGLLQRRQDVLEVVLLLGGDVLQPALVGLLTFHLLPALLQLQQLLALHPAELHRAEAALARAGALIVPAQGRVHLICDGNSGHHGHEFRQHWHGEQYPL
mmetsp:Transcript_75247/g.179673  ORF Transcript_75247/g.179673 Transcript_75247/m.179673 type:complete len:217 (+) Transcript_75247:429-1079(+)